MSRPLGVPAAGWPGRWVARPLGGPISGWPGPRVGLAPVVLVESGGWATDSSLRRRKQRSWG
ncbi:hypothetical protein ACFPM0_17290 [Pseudonocardia sulfidoxydans]|uniref:hypothetical protein n=1 Tax=Pseudonocardia sulfidoxydans TaxID=54011 RepID=UPI0036063412